MSGKSAKNSTDQVKNNDAEKADHDSTPQTLSAAGLTARMRALTDAMSDQGRRLVERVVDSRLGSWWSSTERPGLVDWALLGVILLGAYAFFLYGDVRATFEHSFNFLDSVFRGGWETSTRSRRAHLDRSPRGLRHSALPALRTVEPADVHHLPDHRLPLPAVNAGAAVAQDHDGARRTPGCQGAGGHRTRSGSRPAAQQVGRPSSSCPR